MINPNDDDQPIGCTDIVEELNTLWSDLPRLKQYQPIIKAILEIERLRKLNKWQDMDSAPRDGTIIQLLCVHDAGYWQTVGVTNLRGEWITTTELKTCYPIKWHRLAKEPFNVPETKETE